MPTPSLILVPARFKTGKLYTPVATTSGGLVLGASGDFNVTRATTATRVNASGLIEVVASGIPRLDYFASGGVVGCPALLVEPSGSNGILNSQDTATNWTRGANLSGTYENVIGVSGNNLTVAASGSNIGSAAGRLIRFSNNVALASGSTYTISFLMKKTGAHTIGGYYATITGAASGDIGGGFDVSGSFSSGQIYNTAGTTSRIRRVEQWGTDVYRCSETFTMTASGTLTNFVLAPTIGVTIAGQANPAVGLGIAFAAPQFELGALPTSFMPTTTAAVTRNADVINLSGAVSGCIGQTEGTIYAEVDIRNIADTKAIVQSDDGTTDNRLILFVGTSPNRIQVLTVAAGTNSVVSGSIATGINKIAASYFSGSVQLYLNGSFLASGTPTAFPTVARNNFSLGTRISTGVYGAQFNDRIRSAAIYTTRLTAAELAALTTL
jgi:hypothetical protein